MLIESSQRPESTCPVMCTGLRALIPCYAHKQDQVEKVAEPYLTLCGSQKSIRSFFHSFSSLNSVNVCSLLFTVLCLLTISPSPALATNNLQCLHMPGDQPSSLWVLRVKDGGML